MVPVIVTSVSPASRRYLSGSADSVILVVGVSSSLIVIVPRVRGFAVSDVAFTLKPFRSIPFVVVNGGEGERRRPSVSSRPEL